MNVALKSSGLPTVSTVKELRKQVAAWRSQGLTVGLVPTMGALHEGHLSLVELALKRVDRVITTIFVNPKQFAPHEDFDTYPREENSDSEKLMQVGAHLLYLPEKSEMYPDDFQTSVCVPGLAEGLCTEQRPHFFEGVATIVTKLLIQAMPDVAVFGEKDYQQLCIIKKLTADLDIPVEIVGAPIVRDGEGLALSSRNQYLTEEQRHRARRLNKVLFAAVIDLQRGKDVKETLEGSKQKLKSIGFDKIDYLELREIETLTPLKAYTKPARLFVAARLGDIRLIDNIAIKS